MLMVFDCSVQNSVYLSSFCGKPLGAKGHFQLNMIFIHEVAPSYSLALDLFVCDRFRGSV